MAKIKHIEITKKDVRAFLLQYERAYRRGFQQGHHFCTTRDITAKQVYQYRYQLSLKIAYEAPEFPKQKHNGKRLGTVLDRLSMESHDHDQDSSDLVWRLEEFMKPRSG